MILPISAFWLLSAQIERIQAEEKLWEIQTPSDYTELEDRKKYIDNLTKTLSNPLKYDIIDEQTFDPIGYDRLKALSKQKVIRR